MYCIYQIENIVNHKKYIGITKRSPEIRFNEHLNNKKEILYKVKEKYGKANLILTIIEKNISLEDIDKKERYYIEYYNTLVPNGYNLSKGGLSNKTISEEGRKKLRDCNLGINNPRCNKKIYMIDKNTKKILQIFESTREAARFLGDENKYRAIAYCLNGKTKSSYNYLWEYED